MNWTTLLAVAGLLACAPMGTALADSETEQLYYAIETPFRSGSQWEIRTLGGYDFSNSYLHIYSGSVGAFWLGNRFFSPGLELTAFGSSERSNTTKLREQLEFYGFKVDTIAPAWSSVAALRVSPIAGMVNLFSSRVVSAEISLLVRGGTMGYRGMGLGPVVGTGIELQMGITPTWGACAAFQWEGDKPPGRDWQSRVGARVGPSVRF